MELMLQRRSEIKGQVVWDSLEVEDFSQSVTTLIQQLHMSFAPVLEPILPPFLMCGLMTACDFSPGL